MNTEKAIEKACKEAIKVAEKYLAGDVSAYDIQDELFEAQEAVDCAWRECNSNKSRCLCFTAWWACSHAKDNERSIAKMYVEEYEDLVK